MAVYLINLAAVTLFSILAQRSAGYDPGRLIDGEHKPNTWFVMFIVLSLTLVAGLRFVVGTDYSNYFYMYKQMAWGEATVDWSEPGLPVIMWTLSRFTKEPYLMFFITALACNLLSVYAMRAMAPTQSFWLTMYLFICTHVYYASFNALRQALAIAIILMVAPYLFRKQFWPFAAGVLVAALFHTTALVMLPFYFIVHRPAWSPMMWVLIGTMLGVWALFEVLYNAAFSLLADTRFAGYTLENARGVQPIRILVALAPVLLAFVFRKRLADIPNSHVIVNLCVVGVLFMLLADKQLFLARMGMYFSCFLPLLLPMFIRIFPQKGIRILVTCGILVCYLAYTMVLLPVDSHLLPYRSLFSKPPGFTFHDLPFL